MNSRVVILSFGPGVVSLFQLPLSVYVMSYQLVLVSGDCE